MEKSGDCSVEAGLVFRHLDASSDGSVSPEEFMCGLSDLGMTDSEIEQLFQQIDLDGDGKVRQLLCSCELLTA